MFDFSYREETPEELEFDALRDYIECELVDEQGREFYLSSVKMINPYVVRYSYRGMKVSGEADVHEFLNFIGLAYKRSRERWLK